MVGRGSWACPQGPGGDPAPAVPRFGVVTVLAAARPLVPLFARQNRGVDIPLDAPRSRASARDSGAWPASWGRRAVGSHPSPARWRGARGGASGGASAGRGVRGR